MAWVSQLGETDSTLVTSLGNLNEKLQDAQMEQSCPTQQTKVLRCRHSIKDYVFPGVFAYSRTVVIVKQNALYHVRVSGADTWLVPALPTDGPQ